MRTYKRKTERAKVPVYVRKRAVEAHLIDKLSLNVDWYTYKKEVGRREREREQREKKKNHVKPSGKKKSAKRSKKEEYVESSEAETTTEDESEGNVSYTESEGSVDLHFDSDWEGILVNVQRTQAKRKSGITETAR